MKKTLSSRIKPQIKKEQLEAILAEVTQSNMSMATEQMEQMLDKYFVKDPSTSAFTPVMVPFNIPTSTPGTNATVNIPLLTTIPITLLAIEKAEVFLMSDFAASDEKVVNKKLEQTEQEYDTSITIEQQPLPSGLAMLMNILTSSISPQ